MTLDQAIRQLNKSKPAFGAETCEALDVVIDAATDRRIKVDLVFDEEKLLGRIGAFIRELDDCEGCLRQGCEYRDEIRVNCPLLKTSAV